VSSSATQSVKVFTVDQANAMLPLVQAIVSDLAQLSSDLIERRERIVELGGGNAQDSGTGLHAEELQQSKEDLERDALKLQEYVEELQELGVEPKSGPEGLADFPAMFEGRLVYLCWKLGEPTVSHWHELDGGFAGRQSIANCPSFHKEEDIA
jgi:hypothetical protein